MHVSRISSHRPASSKLSRPLSNGRSGSEERKRTTSPLKRSPYSRRVPRDPKVDLSLAVVLREKSTIFSQNRIKALECGIFSIGSIDTPYQKAEVLLLSNNEMSSLKGIEQFSNVRILSLANNRISDLWELDYLTACESLENVNLEFNPICELPNYRFHVVYRVPTLENLDGLQVTDYEKSRCESVLFEEETILNLMYSNEILIRKLRLAVNRLQVHRELRQLAQGRFSALNRYGEEQGALPRAFDIAKFLHLVDLENTYSHGEQLRDLRVLREAVRHAHNIRHFGGGQASEVSESRSVTDAPLTSALSMIPGVSVARSVPPDWRLAFSEVLLRQQGEVARLLSEIESENREAIEFASRRALSDPRGLLSELRNEEESRQKIIQEERLRMYDRMERSSAGRVLGLDSKPSNFRRNFLLKQHDPEMFSALNLNIPSTPSVPLRVEEQHSNQPQEDSIRSETAHDNDFDDDDLLEPRTEIPVPSQPVKRRVPSEDSHAPYFPLPLVGSSAAALSVEESRFPETQSSSDEFAARRSSAILRHSPTTPAVVENEESLRSSEFSTGKTDPLSFALLPSSSSLQSLASSSSSSSVHQSLSTVPTPTNLHSKEENQQSVGSTKYPNFSVGMDSDDRHSVASAASTSSSVARIRSGDALSVASSRNGMEHSSSTNKKLASRPATNSTASSSHSPPESTSNTPRARMIRSQSMRLPRPRSLSNTRGSIPVTSSVSNQAQIANATTSGAQSNETVESLRRKVELLQADIERRASAEDRLHSLNSQLRERLEQISRQNDENTQRAETEMEALAAEVRRLMENESSLKESLEAEKMKSESHSEEKASLSRQLERVISDRESSIDRYRSSLVQVQQDSDRLQCRSEELYSSMRDKEIEIENLRHELREREMCIEKLSSESEFVRAKAEEFGAELRESLLMDEKMSLAEEFASRKMLVSAFRLFQVGVFYHRLEEEAFRLCREREVSRLQLQFFSIWKEKLYWKIYCHRARVRRDQELVSHCFRTFVWNHEFSMRCKSAMFRRLRVRVRKCFRSWSVYSADRSAERMLEHHAEAHRDYVVVRNCLRSLRKYAHRFDMDPVVERSQTVLANHCFSRILLRRCFNAWLDFDVVYVQPLREKENMANKFFSRLLRRRCWRAWEVYIEQQRRRIEKFRVISERRDRTVLRWTFSEWRDALSRLMWTRISARRAEKSFQRSLFRRWQFFVHQQASEKRKHARALRFFEYRILRRSFRMLTVGVQIVQEERLMNATAVQRYFDSLQKNSFRIWTSKFLTRRRVRIDYLRDVFLSWTIYSRHSKSEDAIIRHIRANRVRSCFVYWRAKSRWLSRLGRFGVFLNRIRSSRIFVECWRFWMFRIRSRLSHRLHESQASAIQLSERLKELSDASADAEIQNVQLVDQVQDLLSECARLRRLLSERDESLENYLTSHEEAVAVENALRTELEKLAQARREADEESRFLREVLAARPEDSEGSAVQLAMQLHDCKERITQLEAELEEREHSLFDTRATLEKTLERLDITNGETSEKVTAALDIASDLRKAVEDRDAELRHLRTSHDLLQSRASELEKRLSSSTDSVVRNLRAREEGLEQMRIQNAQLQHALADASEQLQAARRESEERSEQVRRLKYELELSYERDRLSSISLFSTVANRHSSHIDKDSFSSENSHTDEFVDEEPLVRRSVVPLDPTVSVRSNPVEDRLRSSRFLPSTFGTSGQSRLPSLSSRLLEAEGEPMHVFRSHGSHSFVSSLNSNLGLPAHGKSHSLDSVSGRKASDLSEEIARLQSHIRTRLSESASLIASTGPIPNSSSSSSLSPHDIPSLHFVRDLGAPSELSNSEMNMNRFGPPNRDSTILNQANSVENDMSYSNQDGVFDRLDETLMRAEDL